MRMVRVSGSVLLRHPVRIKMAIKERVKIRRILFMVINFDGFNDFSLQY